MINVKKGSEQSLREEKKNRVHLRERMLDILG
jgi:hypothetical protein